ncbi:MAG: DUF5683 domain-containing protein [Bacteroidetes bacterium]|nr:DUF5683 domain-containing protein [Bacteroidota bacterium]
MKRTLQYWLLLTHCFAIPYSLSSQQVPTIGIQNDSVTYPRTGENSPVYYRPKKSGTLALFLSAVIPGAGQVYTERYYTIPIIWGCGVFFYSQYRVAHNYYKEFKNKYEQSIRLDTLYRTGNSYYKETRDFYHDKRDEFAIYLLLTYIVNIVDAYVGATLYDFDVSPHLDGVTFHYRLYFR